MTENQRAAIEAAITALENDCDWNVRSDAVRGLREVLAEQTEDWDRVEALEASLREHMQEIHRLRAALAEQDHSRGATEMIGGKYQTVVYRSIGSGEEAATLLQHPKMSAASWTHAIRDRDAARSALAKQQDAEPVAYPCVGGTVFGELDGYDIEHRSRICEEINRAHYGYPKRLPLYTHPPRREWQGLTEHEADTLLDSLDNLRSGTILRAVEAALKEKNRG